MKHITCWHTHLLSVSQQKEYGFISDIEPLLVIIYGCNLINISVSVDFLDPGCCFFISCKLNSNFPVIMFNSCLFLRWGSKITRQGYRDYIKWNIWFFVQAFPYIALIDIFHWEDRMWHIDAPDNRLANLRYATWFIQISCQPFCETMFLCWL